MESDAAPSLADDERTLARYATQLGDAFADVAAAWFGRLVDRRAPGLSGQPAVEKALEAGALATATDLRALLQMDIAEQPRGPLEVLRAAVRYPTEVLDGHDIATEPRDEFSVEQFPDDVYGLTPASFADVDPSLHEPGLLWGAAKAHVHLRRRREQTAATPPTPAARIVALSADLMDRSKISAAFPDATLVRSPVKLQEVAVGAAIVIVDLRRLDGLDDLDALVAANARVVGFGSHVAEEVLAAAHARGAEALPRSVFFRRLESGNL